MVAILHDHGEIEKLSGEVRCIWVDRHLVIIEELAYQALLACELPQPSQPQVVRLEPRVVREGFSGF